MSSLCSTGCCFLRSELPVARWETSAVLRVYHQNLEHFLGNQSVVHLQIHPQALRKIHLEGFTIHRRFARRHTNHRQLRRRNAQLRILFLIPPLEIGRIYNSMHHSTAMTRIAQLLGDQYWFHRCILRYIHFLGSP